jgi:hypothetical protein
MATVREAVATIVEGPFRPAQADQQPEETRWAAGSSAGHRQSREPRQAHAQAQRQQPTHHSQCPRLAGAIGVAVSAGRPISRQTSCTRTDQSWAGEPAAAAAAAGFAVPPRWR